MTAWYLDSSAIVKFAVEEPESAVIAEWRAALPRDDAMVTCELAIAEVMRAVRRVGGDSATALTHLDALDQVVVDRELLLAAGRIGPSHLHTLDAIHLAAALATGPDLRAIVTYDDRIADAARVLDLRTLAPA